MNTTLSRPSTDDLEIFCRVAHSMLTDDGKSLARHAHDLGLTKSRVERTMLRISSFYGQEMIGPGKGHGKKLTPAGRDLYDRALPYLDSLEMVTTAAQPLVIRVSDTIQTELLPLALHRFLHVEGWLGKVMLHVRRIDYRVIKEQVLQGKTDFGLGWNLVNERSSFVRSFQPGFQMGIITPPGHPLSQSQPEEIRIRELAESRSLIWCLHAEFLLQSIHRLLGGYPAALRAHCSTYSAIVANVRAGNGVGIVPLWYWKLDKLRERCGLFYTRIQGVPPHYLTAYLPPCDDEDKSGRGRLSAPAKALFDIIENTVWELGMGTGSGEGHG